ncbi:MAG: VWA domain-containing protein [Chloroflexaceae bacterium]|nr:VWA domain-containing protein [Chloroflexaceae bacterium]
MFISFVHPAALWLLALLPLLWLFAWATRRPNRARLSRWRYLALLGARSAILAALVLALAGAQVVRPVDDTAVVFLIDGSDSVAPAQRERALAYVNAALAAGQPADRAAVVVFGASAAVERAPQPPAPLSRLTSVVVSNRTDIAEAVLLGLALLPADAQKRLVLLSDGAQNLGDAVEAARLAALRGVPIEVIPLAAETGADARLVGLDAPATAREGQDVPLTLNIESDLRGPARVEVLADGQLVAAEEVTLAEGAQSFLLRAPAGEAGFRRFEARISAAGDTQPLNNTAGAFTEVEGPPRVLLVAEAEDRAAPLRAALTAAGLRPTLVGPPQVAADPAALRQFAAVILVDVPANAVPPALQRALVTYVREQGGGLAMIGGANSFGAGGWRRTPIAEVLPVDLDPPARERRPDLALALVIDRSGSMADTAGGGRNRLDLAKDAVFLATQGLAARDQLGIYVFDDRATTVLPLQPLPPLAAIEDALGLVSLGGGTNIRAGIELAAPALIAADARVKHMILLTDGLDNSNYADLVEQMRERDVTITVVSIGGAANPRLERAAREGGGAFYRVTRADQVPAIFLSETVRAAERDLVEEVVTPVVALPAPPVRDLEGVPPLYGYNNTGRRATARTFLITPDGAPLLAVWQVGLGRTLAWTSDLKGQWAAEWIGWEQFPRFTAGLVDAVLPPAGDERLTLEMRADGGEATLNLVVSDAEGLPAQVAAVQGRLLDPAGNGLALSFTQVAPGRYRAIAPADQPGVYLAQVTALDAAGQPLGAASGGLVVSYSPEYRPDATGAALLESLAAISGGRVAPPPQSLFESPGQRVGRVTGISQPLLWLALALLPLDIALRRLFLRPVGPLRFPARRARPAAAPESADALLARLRAARERARRPAPPPSARPPRPPTAETPAAPPASAPAPADDRLAALLAAKQRRKRSE